MSPEADAMLAELAAQGSVPMHETQTERVRRAYIAQAAEGRNTAARYDLSKIRYSHADCIDRILTSPSIKQKDLAQIYGVTETWMSIVINCDAFKAALAERKAELIDPVLAATLNERFGALAARSVEVLLEKLAKPADQISDKLALEAASLGARVAVPTPVGGGGPNAADHLAALAHRLIDLNRPGPPPIEGATRVID